MRRTQRIITQIGMTIGAMILIVFFQNCGIQRPQVTAQDAFSVSFTHTGMETSCSSCHNDIRPTSSVGFIGLDKNAPFDYDTHAGSVDCIECHRPTAANRTSADWAGGHFNHPSTLSSCESCHSSQRPLTYGNNTAHPAAGDCIGCHEATQKTQFASMADWSGGKNVASADSFDPGQNLTIQSYSPTFSGTTIASISKTSVVLNMKMNHSSRQLSGSTQANCSLCHSGAASGNYFPGKFHASLSAAGLVQPTSCGDCHNSANPSGMVGVVDTTRSPQTPAMNHAAVTWSQSAAGVWSSTSSNKLVLVDCGVCHAAGAGKWGGVKYHASLSAGGVGQPSSCLDCHANSRKVGPVKSSTASIAATAFDHSIKGIGLGDCITCHTDRASWSGAKLHTSVASLSARCYDCHSGTIDNTKGFDHGTVNFTSSDCSSCHALNRTAPTWAGAKAAPATYTIPSHTSGGVTIAGYTGTHTTNSNCTACHGTGDYTKITNFDHQGLPATSNSCVSCHLGAKADVAGFIASTSTLKVRAFDSRHHASSKFKGTNLSCVGCHAVTLGASTFTNSTVVYPSTTQAAYVSVGCGSVKSTFACHEGGQQTMKIPITSTATGSW